MFLPGCGCCPPQPQLCPGCPTCAVESLPDTVTVSLSDIRVQGPDLIQVAISSCFGSGAAGRITGPIGTPGAIAGAAVVSGGSGYAKRGRVEPTVSAAGGGTGATLTVSLSQSTDACGIPYWAVSGVTASGGTGYLDGSPVTFSVADGDTEETPASATIHTTRAEPTLTAIAAGGSGAELEVTLSDNGNGTWAVASVAVTNGGSGYTDGGAVTFSLGSGDQLLTAAAATINVDGGEPEQPSYSTNPTGIEPEGNRTATFTLAWTPNNSYPNHYDVASVTIDDGGSGYVVGDLIRWLAPHPDWEFSVFWRQVASVDGNGAIVSLDPYDTSDPFLGSVTGPIQSVTVSAGGAYYNDSGVPSSVSVANGGVYYREDIEAEPYVADVTVTLTQEFSAGCYSEGFEFDPENATGAVVTATVGDDPTNPATFGKITGFSVSNGGSGWLASLDKASALEWFDGKTFVLQRDGCVYSASCLSGTHFSTAIEFHPFTAVYACKPRIILLTNAPYDAGGLRPNCFATAALSSDTEITICDELRPAANVDLAFVPVPGTSPGYLPCTSGGPWSETLVSAATATVTVGGQYTPAMKCFSAQQSELNAISVQAQFAGETFDFVPTSTETECETDFQWSPYYDAADCEYADDIIPASGILKFCRAQKTVTCDPDFLYLNTRWVCESWLVTVSIDDATTSAERSCSPYWKVSLSATYNRWELGDGQTLTFDNVSSIGASRVQTWYILKEDSDYPTGTFTVPAFEGSPLSPNYGEQQGNLVVTLTAPP